LSTKKVYHSHIRISIPNSFFAAFSSSVSKKKTASTREKPGKASHSASLKMTLDMTEEQTAEDGAKKPWKLVNRSVAPSRADGSVSDA